MYRCNLGHLHKKTNRSKVLLTGYLYSVVNHFDPGGHGLVQHDPAPVGGAHALTEWFTEDVRHGGNRKL